MAATPEVDDNEDEAPAAPAAPSLDKAYPSQMAEAARKDAPSADISLGGDDPNALTSLVTDQKTKADAGEARIAADQAEAKAAGLRKSAALGGMAKEASVYQKALSDFDMNNPFPQPMVEKWTDPAPTLDPLRAFGNWGTVFGVLASAFTKRPLQNAFNSAGAAMAAAHEADVESWTKNREVWKDNQALAMKQAEWSQKKYEAALNLMATKHDAGMTEWKATAAMEDNNTALAVTDATQATEYLNRLRTGVNDGFVHQKAMDDYADRQSKLLTAMSDIAGGNDALKNLSPEDRMSVRAQALDKIAQDDKEDPYVSAAKRDYLAAHPDQTEVPADELARIIEKNTEVKSSPYLKGRDFGGTAGAMKPEAILERRLKAWEDDYVQKNGHPPDFAEREDMRRNIVATDTEIKAHAQALGSGKLAADAHRAQIDDQKVALGKLREENLNTRETDKNKTNIALRTSQLEEKIAHDQALEDTSNRSLEEKTALAKSRLQLDGDKLEYKKHFEDLKQQEKGTLDYANSARKLEEARSRMDLNQARIAAITAPKGDKQTKQADLLRAGQSYLDDQIAAKPELANASDWEKAKIRAEGQKIYSASTQNLTPNQAAKLQGHVDDIGDAMDQADKALTSLDAVGAAAGVLSKPGRALESIQNILNTSSETTRHDFVAQVAGVKLLSERLLKSGGVFNAQDQKLLQDMIGLDSWGDNYANVRARLNAFGNLLYRKQNETKSLLKGSWAAGQQTPPPGTGAASPAPKGLGMEAGSVVTPDMQNSAVGASPAGAPPVASPAAPGPTRPTSPASSGPQAPTDQAMLGDYKPSPFASVIMAGENTSGDPGRGENSGTSSGVGNGQFLKGTWLRLAHSEYPETRTMSDEDVLAMRKDPVLAAKMVDKLAVQNAAELRRMGIGIDPSTLWLAHHYGSGGAAAITRAARSNPKALASEVLNLDPEDAKANGISGLTASQVFMQGFEATKSIRSQFQFDKGTPAANAQVAATPPPPAPKAPPKVPLWQSNSSLR